MRSAYCRWLLVGLLATSSAVGTTGCGNDQETINRVQPNAVEKSMFSGEWYTKGTIVDTQVDAPIYVGSETGFERIQWDIQENVLLAKRTYTKVRDIETSAILGEESEKSSIVAAYRITSHFDIRREYNPATGEQTNVVSENTVDRPWYERDYMRVDWSQNLLEQGELGSVYSPMPVKLTPVALFEQGQAETEEEKNQLAPYFETDEDGNVVYFDLVNKFWAEPAKAMQDIDGDGKAELIDACGLTVNSQMDCGPGAVAVRYSFARVEDRDYQPMEYTQDRMSRFGFFLTKRDSYDVDYGTTVRGRGIFVNRHNIWMQSHLKDEAGSLISCTAADAAAEVIEEKLVVKGIAYGSEAYKAELGKKFREAGLTARSACMLENRASRCDMALASAAGTATGACTIPYQDREIRPIRYYVTSNLPEFLVPDALEIGKQWNIAFTQTVASLRKLECEQNGGKDCAKHTPESAGDVFVVCRNPVTEKDSKACGEVGFAPRYGDVRHSFISWVDEAHSKYAGAPLGLGPAMADPLTGEVVSGVANLYGDGFDIYATFARDMLAMMQGELPFDGTQSSTAFADYISQIRAKRNRTDSLREADRHVIPLDGHDMQQANDDMTFEWALARLPKYSNSSTQYIKEMAPTQWKAIGAMHEKLNFGAEGRAKLAQLRGTYLEDVMLNDEYGLMMGAMPGQTITEEQKAQISPFSPNGAFGHRGKLNATKAMLRNSANRMGCLISANEFHDDGLMGLLMEIDEAVSEGDGKINWYGVDYELFVRDAAGKPTRKIDYDKVKDMLKHPMFFGLTAHEVGHSIGLRHNFSGSFDAINYHPNYWKLRDDGEIRSRALDPMSEREIKGRIREFQYSTVMDYGHNFVVTEAHGVGHYDIAAIKMGYGDITEVFTDAPAANHTAIAGMDAQASPFMVFQVDPRTSSGASLTAFHYSSWPELLGNVGNMEKRRDAFYRHMTFVPSALFGDGGFSLLEEKDGKTSPVVPYLYCGDEFADSRPPCMRYDAGADAFETMQSVIDDYWNGYPFSHFMRQRIGWDPAAVEGRSVARYFDKLASASHIYALYRQFLEPFLGAPFFEQEDGFGLYTLGVRATYDLFRQVIATPEPGTRLGMEELVDGTRIVSADPAGGLFDTAPVQVNSFNGRYLRSTFDIGPAFEWIFFSSAGWFKDKAAAMEAMLYADTGFLGTDTSPDVREYSSSFYTIFQDSMSEFMRAVFAGDVAAYAPRVNNKGLFVYPSPSDILSRGKNVPGDIVSPNVGFTLQMSAMAYGMSLIPNTFDQDFINRSRIFTAGSSDAVDIDLPAGMVSYKDARSGMTYYAPSYVRDDVKGMEGTPVETGAGAAMINYANALKARVDEAVADGDGGEAAAWQAKLQDYVDNLDILRFLGSRLGHGSDGEFLGNQ